MKIFTASFLTAALLIFNMPDITAQYRKSIPPGLLNEINLSSNRPIKTLQGDHNNRPPANQTAGNPTPVVEWHKCLGGNYGEYGSSIKPTADGGYVVAGYSTSADNGDVMGHHGNATVGDIWVIKLDKAGNTEWQKSIGGTDSEQGAFILPTPDGGYIVTGGASSNGCGISGGHGGLDYFVTKLSGNGDIIWQKLYGGSEEDLATSVALSTDGGYFVSRHSYSNNGDVTINHGFSDLWIIKIDATGNLKWQKSLGGSDYDGATSIQASADGGCIAAGFVQSNNGDITGYHGAGDCWVVKLDKAGALQWQKALGGSNTEIAWCVQVTNDGGYIISGSSNSNDGNVSGLHAGGYDCWIIKLDAAGNIAWQKCYGGSSNETGYYIQLTADGGYVIAGSALSADGDLSCNAGAYDFLIMKINSTGTLEWQKTLGGSGIDEANCVQPLTDGGFIVAGYTSSSDVAGFHMPYPSAGDIADYWVIKLSAPLTAVPVPVVTINPASALVCAGGKATISASVLYGGVNPVYQWTKNAMPVGTNSPYYSDVNFSNNDQVKCIVTGGTLCENTLLQGTGAITVKVNANAITPVITILADNASICNCTTIKIIATVTNAGASPNYRWLINGINTGYTNAILISNNLKTGDVVTCEYSDNATCGGNGAITSNTITFNAANNNTPTLTIAASADTICKGSLVKFIATPFNAGTNPVYQWKINNLNVGTNNPELISSTIANADIVTCTITSDPLTTCNAAFSAVSNSILMHTTIAATPEVTIAASSATICKGSLVNFTATSSNAGTNPTFQWKVNGVAAGSNNQVFSSSAIANGDVINCTINIDPTYSCAVTNQAVSANIIMTVNNGNLPSIAINTNNNNACAGEFIRFTATASDAGAAPSYQWILNNTILTETSPVFNSSKLVNGDRLYCKLLPGTGACSSLPDSSNVIIAAIKDTTTVYIIPADTTIAPGSQVLLKPITSNNILSFIWTPADKLLNAASLNSLTTSLVESTNYKLEIINGLGCKSTALATVRIFTPLYMPKAFTPNGDGLNDLYRIPRATSLTLTDFTIYDRWGNRIFTTKNIGDGWDGTINGKKQNAGSYIYVLNCSINNKELLFKGLFLLVR
jgi:gliding motility-associated-like protein